MEVPLCTMAVFQMLPQLLLQHCQWLLQHCLLWFRA
jgi:hypothetical protein